MWSLIDDDEARHAFNTRGRPTAPFEESPLVAQTLVDLGARCEAGGASSIRFLPARATTYEAFAFAFGTKLPKQMNITRTSEAPVRGTLIVNASGNVAGALLDRVVGYALRFIDVGDDALQFEALRASCKGAVDDLGRGVSSTTIELHQQRTTITRALFGHLKNASLASDEAIAGNRALRMHYGATNTYDVHIRMQNGDTIDVAATRNDPARIELATRIALEIPACDGDVLLEAAPSGGDVEHYVEARRYIVRMGADRFDVKHAVEVAKKFQSLHADVRWGTENERADRERLGVGPSPMPYQDW